MTNSKESNCTRMVNELRLILMESEIPQKVMAQKIDVPLGTINGVLNYRHIPRIDTVEKLANGLGYRVALIKDDNGAKPYGQMVGIEYGAGTTKAMKIDDIVQSFRAFMYNLKKSRVNPDFNTLRVALSDNGLGMMLLKIKLKATEAKK